MSPSQLSRFVGPHPGQKSLHRFWKVTAANVVSAARRLVNQYRGDAANVWGNDPGAAEVLRRLQEFDGISQKIANMTVRLLITYYGVNLTGWHQVDIAVDRHVARVFLRTGLVVSTGGRTSYAGSELRDKVIERARSLFPSYPGALDEPAFVIGRSWCTADHAYCHDGAEVCPLIKACPQNRRRWQII
jgi:endonuclease III